jgi:hypothetical protein
MPLSRNVVALAAGMVSVLSLPPAASARTEAQVSRLRGRALVRTRSPDRESVRPAKAVELRLGAVS